MAGFSSQFLKTLAERGFIHQCTDEKNLDSLMHTQKPVPAYIGFDCTAPSLHVGSLVQIMALRWLQKAGHKPIVLMGGGTTKVGDPSGKDESRKILDDAAIKKNMEGIKSVFSKFITFETTFDPKSTNAFMVNNADWLDGLEYIPFLREYGRLISVNKMLSMESVKLRLEREQHLSFLEFNYMVLQAYDFVKLNELYECRVQIGGSDQYGNIIRGVDLFKMKANEDYFALHGRYIHAGGGKTREEANDDFRKNVENFALKKELFGLTTPLITTASGAKMGKSSAGAVWLNGEMTTPYDYWQFWRNTEDADVGRFLKFFTELPLDEVKKLENLQGADINKAKIALANATTTMVHGEKAAKEAEETARKTFEQGGVGGALPVVEIASARLKEGIEAYNLLFEAGLTASKSEARKLIRGGGGKVNNVKFADEAQKVTLADMQGDGIKLSAGSKRHVLVKAV